MLSRLDALLHALEKCENAGVDFAFRRAAANSIGRRVELADLSDNCNLSRIAAPTEHDHQRIEKYRRAIKLILLNSESSNALIHRLKS